MWEDLREFSQPIEMQNFSIKRRSQFPLTNEVDTSGLSITINYAATWWGRPLPAWLLLTICGLLDTVEILIRSDCGLDIILSVAFYTQIANYISKYNRKNKLSTISYFILPFLNKKKKQFNSLCRNAALSVAVTYRNLLSINVGIYAINKPHLAGVGVPGVECPQTISAKSTIN